MHFKNFLFVILITPAVLFAQADTSSSKDSTTIKKIASEKTDTTLKYNNPLSLLHLKIFLDTKMNNLSIIKPGLSKNDDEVMLYDLSKEELNSGLTNEQLIAYKKNKILFRRILNEKYENCWWYHVKSLGELIGVPDWIIKAMQFSLLLF